MSTRLRGLLSLAISALAVGNAFADDDSLRPARSNWTPELVEGERSYAQAVVSSLVCSKDFCRDPATVRAVYLPSFDSEWIVWAGPSDTTFEVCTSTAQSNIYGAISETEGPAPRIPTGSFSCAPLSESSFRAIRKAWLAALLDVRYPELDFRQSRMVTMDGASYRYSTWGEGVGPLEGFASNPSGSSPAGHLQNLADLLHEKAAGNPAVSSRVLEAGAALVVSAFPKRILENPD